MYALQDAYRRANALASFHMCLRHMKKSRTKPSILRTDVPSSQDNVLLISLDTRAPL
jgi:hypothetical protein